MSMMKKLLTTMAILLLIGTAYAEDIYVTVTINEAPPTPITGALTAIGDGVGAMLDGMGAPITVFLIIMSVGGMIGYVLANIGKKAGGSV
jgi:hypothetical protein